MFGFIFTADVDADVETFFSDSSFEDLLVRTHEAGRSPRDLAKAVQLDLEEEVQRLNAGGQPKWHRRERWPAWQKLYYRELISLEIAVLKQILCQNQSRWMDS